MHLPTITVDTIPHKKQRYPTVGDYYKSHGKLHIKISKTNSNHEFLVLIHELIEWYLTSQKGVKIQDIDSFDISFENQREPGNTEEPGDNPNAPYYQEHQFATKIEREVAEYLGVDWDKYEEHVINL